MPAKKLFNRLSDKLNDQEFIQAYKKHGATKLSKIINSPVYGISARAQKLNVRAPKNLAKPNGVSRGWDPSEIKAYVERIGLGNTAKKYDCHPSTIWHFLKKRKIDYTIQSDASTANGNNTASQTAKSHPQRVELDVQNGVVLVFSDAHYWPGNPGVSHRALVKMAHEMEPAAIVCNGDAVDMAAVSRHPPIGWEKQPTVQEEIETAQERLEEIISACTKRTRRTWNLGNHDARFETRLASVAPEFAKLAGIHLHDHFPEWERAWSTWINDSVVIKHRYKGGVHATHNNTVSSGKTLISGHLHSAKVTPFTDYNGTRFGVDTGCLADTWGKQFINYTEDNPLNWISAFGVLTFRHGKLLWPELVVAFDEQSVQFRGKIIEV